MWDRLAGFTIGPENAQLDFIDRLARDNGWSRHFAERVVDEYKRFVFLGQVAGHPVTPSDEVDQVWHLHLTYTRSYWEDLCRDILGRPFHHGPTRGGEAEGAKFEDWYARTQKSYEEWFGSAPPADIWPEPSIRFGDAPFYVRVNTRRQFVVKKPDGRTVGRLSQRAGLPVLAGLVLAGCSGLGVTGMLAQGGADWRDIIGVLVVLGLVALGGLAYAGWKSGGGGPFGGSGCGGFGGGGGCGGGGCGGGGCGG